MTEKLEDIIKRIYDKALGISGQQDTAKNKFTVESVVNNGLIYCNRNDIPLQMEQILTQMSVDALIKGSVDTQAIKKIKEGDREEEYFENSSTAFSDQSLLDMFRKIKSYKAASNE